MGGQTTHGVKAWRAGHERRFVATKVSLPPRAAAARLLLDRGADPNLANSLGTTPLMTAGRFDSLPLLRLLIEAKAELNAAGANGWTAFLYTCARGSAGGGADHDATTGGDAAGPCRWCRRGAAELHPGGRSGRRASAAPAASRSWALRRGLPRPQRLRHIRAPVSAHAPADAPGATNASRF